MGRLRKKRDELVRALDGSTHQRFLLEEQLRHIDELNAHVDRLSAEIERRMRPFEEALAASPPLLPHFVTHGTMHLGRLGT